MMKYLDIKTLVLWDRNPRKISKSSLEKLKRNIEKFKDLFEDRPCLVNDIDGELIVYAGNHKLKAALALGWDKVPCIVRSISEDEMRQRAMLDNAQFAENDYNVLLNDSYWNDIDYSDFNIDVPELEVVKSAEGDFDPTPAQRAISKEGDIYTLGSHRLVCGSSLDLSLVSKLFGERKAAMMFTDPPYNVDYKGGQSSKRRKVIENDNMSDEDFKKFLKEFIVNAKPFVRGDAYICMSTTQLFNLKEAFEEVAVFSDFIIWVKNTFTLGRANYQKQFEPILYGWFSNDHYWAGARNVSNVFKDSIEVMPNGKKCMFLDDSFYSNVWEHNKPHKSKLHPTMKPVELVQRAVRNSSARNSIVYDPFLGSGTTLIACEHLNRVCFGCELDPLYADVIVRRYIKYVSDNHLPVKLSRNDVEIDVKEFDDERS